VHYRLLLQVLQRRNQLRRVQSHDSRVKTLVVHQQVRQVSILATLKHEVEIRLVDRSSVQINDERVAHLLEQVSLAKYVSLLAELNDLLLLNGLYSYLGARFLVLAQNYLSVSTLSDLLS